MMLVGILMILLGIASIVCGTVVIIGDLSVAFFMMGAMAVLAGIGFSVCAGKIKKLL